MSERSIHIHAFLRSVRAACSVATYQSYKERLGVFLKWAGLRTLTPSLFEDYKNFLIESGRSRRTVVCYYNTLRFVYTWAVNTQRISRNPVPPLRNFAVPESERQVFTKEDLDRVLLVMPEKWQLITLLAYHTGQRLGDLACLTWGNVDLTNQTITLTPRKTKRFGKQVSIPIPPFLATRLSQWRMSYPKECSGLVLFPTFCKSYGSFQHRWLSAAFIEYCTKAGLSLSFHCLRHSFVSRLANNGTPPMVIASMTGHSLKQIMSYAHIGMDAKRKALYNESAEGEADRGPLPVSQLAAGDSAPQGEQHLQVGTTQ